MKGQKSLPGAERKKKVFQFAAGSKPDFHLLLSCSVNQAPEEHSLCILWKLKTVPRAVVL